MDVFLPLAEGGGGVVVTPWPRASPKAVVMTIE
jgi:hypothetical protein